LEANIDNLVKRMKNGSYKPKPTRRVYIPKDGSDKMRPLGISSYEDKLVENAIAQILTMIYEPKFYNVNFGFRPNKNCHQAVAEIIEDVTYRKTDYIVEADIKGVTDNMKEISKFLLHTKWLLYKWLNRRSERKSYTVDTFFNGLLRTFPLVEPRIKVSLFYR